MRRFFYLILLFAAISCSSKSEQVEDVTDARPSLSEEALLGRAMRSYDGELFQLSREAWEELRTNYPNSYLLPLAELKIADSYFYSGDYSAALAAYEDFQRVRARHESIPYVMFQLGECHLKQYRGDSRDRSPLTRAIEAFRQVLREYPMSEYADLSERRVKAAREQLAEHELSVAEFYWKKGMKKALDARLNTFSRDFVDTEVYKRAEAEGLFGGEKSLAVFEGPKVDAVRPGPPQLVNAFLQEGSVTRARFSGDLDKRVSAVMPSKAEMSMASRKVSPNLSLVQGVSCEKINDADVLTFYLNQKLQIVSKDDAKLVFSTSGEELPERIEVLEVKDNTCDFEEGVFQYFTREGTPNSPGLVVVKQEKKKHYIPLLLDRPFRLVVVSRAQAN